MSKKKLSSTSNNTLASQELFIALVEKVEEIAETLQVNGISALPYHAGLEAKTRVRHQDAFLMEEIDVIVATIAFGMGIDKPDIRFVIHHDIPKSLKAITKKQVVLEEMELKVILSLFIAIKTLKS